ncbi:MAG TPA: universal stress protein [Acidimicrobiia bacterium]|jgi:nucleotide-binding universal stress UspA family protein
MTHTIVAGVDGSTNSFAALAAAAELAEQSGSRLAVVFVHDPGVAHAIAATYEGTAEPIIERTLAELEAASRERAFDLLADRVLEWTFDVIAGQAAHGLIDAATREDASLIVVGGRGHSVLGGLILGSVAQKLVRSSPISVLVVRHPVVNDNPVARLQHSAP